MHIVTYVQILLYYNDWLLFRMEKFSVKVFLRHVQNLDVIEVKYSGIRIVVVLNALWVSFTLFEVTVYLDQLICFVIVDPNQPHKQGNFVINGVCSVYIVIIVLAVTCKQNGFIYQDGDVWNPYFPKFGVVDCLNCTCTVMNKSHLYIFGLSVCCSSYSIEWQH